MTDTHTMEGKRSLDDSFLNALLVQILLIKHR